MNYKDRCSMSSYMNPHIRNDLINIMIYTLLAYLVFNDDTKRMINNIYIQLCIYAFLLFIIKL